MEASSASRSWSSRLNKRLAKQPYKAMIYPNRDKATGKLVPNSYLIGWEYSTNDDFQDVVCQLDNVILIDQPHAWLALNRARIWLITLLLRDRSSRPLPVGPAVPARLSPSSRGSRSSVVLRPAFLEPRASPFAGGPACPWRF